MVKRARALLISILAIIGLIILVKVSLLFPSFVLKVAVFEVSLGGCNSQVRRAAVIDGRFVYVETGPKLDFSGMVDCISEGSGTYLYDRGIVPACSGFKSSPVCRKQELEPLYTQLDTLKPNLGLDASYKVQYYNLR